MSRTDVHRPWAVQVADPYNRHRLYRQQRWPWEHVLVPTYVTCGCNMCTGRPWLRRARRQERHNTTRALRVTAALWAAGEPIDDEPTITAPDTW